MLAGMFVGHLFIYLINIKNYYENGHYYYFRNLKPLRCENCTALILASIFPFFSLPKSCPLQTLHF